MIFTLDLCQPASSVWRIDRKVASNSSRIWSVRVVLLRSQRHLCAPMHLTYVCSETIYGPLNIQYSERYCATYSETELHIIDDYICGTCLNIENLNITGYGTVVTDNFISLGVENSNWGKLLVYEIEIITIFS